MLRNKRQGDAAFANPLPAQGSSFGRNNEAIANSMRTGALEVRSL